MATLFKSLPLALAVGCACATLTTLAADSQVVVSEGSASYTLQNGTVAVRISKTSGDLLSLEYQGLEMLHKGGRGGGYWSHNVALGRAAARVTINPADNGGERGEVSLKASYTGTPLGSGPGGSAIADIEIRYALGRGDSGLYTYCVFEHKTNYPAFSLGEARFCAKLNDELFDWMTVDARRNLQMLTAYDWNHGTVMNMKEARRLNTGIHKGEVEHKYDYTANQFDVRAWGWSSTAKNVGVWFINPSVEYLSGGPTKFELCAHRDATFGTNTEAPAPPTLLNYWRSSHYGGSSCVVREGESWTKVVGPFFIYCNSRVSRDALWQDALKRAAVESTSWPYDWVSGIDYPNRAQRGSVSGKLILKDPGKPAVEFQHLLVGLSAPDYAVPAGRRASSAYPVDWQLDAKHYEFWAAGEPSGRFTIPNVRPGVYHVHALADGVLGELTITNVAVSSGQKIDLGDVEWRPLRYGRQLWDIGIPNRTASEFFKGGDYFHWGWYLEYPKLFPEDVVYTVGKSDFRKDWFFEQVPHNENPSNTTGTGPGRATPWKVIFDLESAPRGTAVLRLAICGVGTRRLDLAMNGTALPAITNLVQNATINRDGIGGTWSEHDLRFDASLMKAGNNVLDLTLPAGTLTSGIIYDYLRLEVEEAQK